MKRVIRNILPLFSRLFLLSITNVWKYYKRNVIALNDNSLGDRAREI